MDLVDLVRTPSNRLIDLSRIESCAEELRARYVAAEPWHHLVLDDFLVTGVAAHAARAFPPLPSKASRLARAFGARRHDADLQARDPIFEEIFEELHGSRMVALVERVTGIAGLRPDRTLSGAGLHQGGRGSYLRLHADHNTHPADAGTFRRVNVMIYLNESWEPAWNGALELWERDASRCRLKIEPAFNRAVVMSVDDTAFHAYGPLRTPLGRSRNALATYYYTDIPAPGQWREPHFTVWPRIPNATPLEPLVHRARMYCLTRFGR